MSYTYRTPRLDRFALAQLAIATDDPNPVHHDHTHAVACGLPGVIGSGLFVLGLLDKAVRDTAGVDAGYTFDVRMRAPILPDAALEIAWDDTDGSITVGSVTAEGAPSSIATGSLRLNGCADG